MKKGLVSIIIVNYNGKNLLRIILDSIKKSSFRNHEITVVDNNSSDGSQEFVKKDYEDVKLVENKENLGYSGINSALKYCKGEFILFLNNDMEINKDCIKDLVKTIKSDKNIAMAAPKLINFYNKGMKSGGTWLSRAFYGGHVKENNGYAREIPYLGVGLIKKELVDTFGYLFDPDYFIYAEDVDLGLRIRLSGKKVIFEPSAVIYHMHAVTMQQTSRAFATFLMERNLLVTFFKILSLKNIVLLLPYALLARALAVIRDVAAFRFANAFSRLKAVFWVMFNLKFVYEKRKQAQKLRKAGDKFILEVFSEKYLFKRQFIV